MLKAEIPELGKAPVRRLIPDKIPIVLNALLLVIIFFILKGSAGDLISGWINSLQTDNKIHAYIGLSDT